MFKELGFTKIALSRETAMRAAVKALMRSHKSSQRMGNIMFSEKLMRLDTPSMAPQAAIMLKNLEKDMIKNYDRAKLWSNYKKPGKN